MQKKSKVIGLFVSLIGAMFLLDMTLVNAATVFTPTPGVPNENFQWDFDTNTIVSLELKMYQNEQLLTTQIMYYNISDCNLGLFDPDENDIEDLYYFVELQQLFFNGTTNSLEKIPIDEDNLLLNASLINFTNTEMYPFNYWDGPPVANPFIPKNGTTLALDWCGNALCAYYEEELPMIASQYQVVGNSIYIDDAFMFTESYANLTYYANGTLEKGDLFADISFMSIPGLQNYRFVYTRNFDFNPLDEISWAVGENDIFYLGMNLNETLVKVIAIENINDGIMPFQVVYANLSVWDPILEQWNLTEFNSSIGMANEQYIVPGRLVPVGTTAEDLAWYYRAMGSYYDQLMYHDYYLKARASSTGESWEFSYFPNGIPQYVVIKAFPESGGYLMDTSAAYNWIDISGTGTYLSTISGGDDESQSISLPWAFTFYGTSYNKIYISSNGWMSFTNPDVSEYSGTIPSNEKDCVALFWDDLNPGDSGDIYYQFLTAPNRLVIEYDNVYNINDDVAGTFEVIFYQIGNITFQYQDVQYIDSDPVTVGLDHGDRVNYNSYEEITEDNLPISNLAINFSFVALKPAKLEITTVFYKNMTEYLTGIHQIDIDVFDRESEYNITVDFELIGDTQFFFAGVPRNPTNVSLTGDYVFIDLMVNKTANLVFPVNLSITCQSSQYDYGLFGFNTTTYTWEQIPLVKNSPGNYTATLNHLSIYAFGYVPPPDTNDEGDDDDDSKKDKSTDISIPFGNFYLIIMAIGVISAVLYKKRKILILNFFFIFYYLFFCYK